MRPLVVACALAVSGCHAVTGDFGVVDVVGDWERQSNPDISMALDGDNTGSTELPYGTGGTVDIAIYWVRLNADTGEYAVAHTCNDLVCQGVVLPGERRFHSSIHLRPSSSW